MFQFLGQVSIKSQNELQPENVMSRKKCHLKIHTARHRTEICGHVILCYTTQRRTSNDIYTKKHTQNGSHELKMPSFPARNMLWKDCDGKSTPTLSSPLHKPSQPSQPSQPWHELRNSSHRGLAGVPARSLLHWSSRSSRSDGIHGTCIARCGRFASRGWVTVALIMFSGALCGLRNLRGWARFI